ncbi:DUF2502 domain-containing protein [Erwinia sp. HR93]|uniref:DUF2502 domain-containing protein n=1 Tax=Erwinia sp. HR93 TaxID=3094840 RepID=UPI002ADEABAB|nr:DUF2502 domain-containing protein [Erwinia sp. HR93]MEA1065610.1 DUF2502 domain-containing protein [Erwinia sp. HR93]
MVIRSVLLAAIIVMAAPLTAFASHDISLLPGVKLKLGDRDDYGNFWDGGRWRDNNDWHRHWRWHGGHWQRHNGYERGWGRDYRDDRHRDHHHRHHNHHHDRHQRHHHH